MIARLIKALRRPSLLRRLILILVVAGGLVALKLALFLVWTVQKRDMDNMNILVARGLLAVIQDEAEPERLVAGVQRIQAIDEAMGLELGLNPEMAKAAYQVFRRDQGMIYRTPKAPHTQMGNSLPGLGTVRVEGVDWRVATAVTPDGQLWVHAGMREADRRTLLWFLGGANFLLIALGFLGACIFFALAAHRGLRPLAQLAELVKRRHPGDLNPVIPHTSYVETAPLVEALNRLLAETRELLDIQCHFIADAAHELRTPLAVVSAQAHVLGAARTQEERALALKDLQEGLDRGALLIRQLLTVARLDTQARRPQFEPIELNALLQGVASGMAPRFLQAGLDLAYFGREPVTLSGDAVSLRSALENLLENALKYAGAGSQVDLRLFSEGNEVCIQVADNGQGVSPEHLPHLLERFYRVPGNTATGSGLGLAIVQRVAEEHGGRLLLGAGLEERGLGVTLRLLG